MMTGNTNQIFTYVIHSKGKNLGHIMYVGNNFGPIVTISMISVNSMIPFSMGFNGINPYMECVTYK